MIYLKKVLICRTVIRSAVAILDLFTSLHPRAETLSDIPLSFQADRADIQGLQKFKSKSKCLILLVYVFQGQMTSAIWKYRPLARLESRMTGHDCPKIGMQKSLFTTFEVGPFWQMKWKQQL